MCPTVLICWLTDVLMEQQYRSIFFFFVALNFKKNFLSNFSLVPLCIFINVIASSNNCCLKTVNHLERLEFFSDGKFSQFFCFFFKKFLTCLWFLKNLVIKVWNHLCYYCLSWFQNYQKGNLYETWKSHVLTKSQMSISTWMLLCSLTHVASVSVNSN